MGISRIINSFGTAFSDIHCLREGECANVHRLRAVRHPLQNELTHGKGPDVCIDAVGMEAHAGSTIDAVYDRAKQAVMPLARLIVRLLARLLVYSFAHSLVRSFDCYFVRSFVCSLVHLFANLTQPDPT